MTTPLRKEEEKKMRGPREIETGWPCGVHSKQDELPGAYIFTQCVYTYKIPQFVFYGDVQDIYFFFSNIPIYRALLH